MRASEAAVNDLWRRYKDSSLGYDSALGYGSIELRNHLVVTYMSLVRYVASRVAVGLPPTIIRDDLVSYGTIGLIDAITKFDPDRGNKFETYAVTRIRGQIVDDLRTLDRVPRSIRAKAKLLLDTTAKLKRELGREPQEAELAACLNLTTNELWVLQREASVTAVISLEEHDEGDDQMKLRDSIRDATANPEDVFAVESEMVTLLAAAIDQLPERSKTILVLYYLHEMTLAGIGEVLGVTESRVCQLQSRLLESLGSSLTHGAALALA